MVISCIDAPDQLVWETSLTGKPSVNELYSELNTHKEKTFWGRSIRRTFIPPKVSLLVWRIRQNWLPVDDNLWRRGMVTVSCFYLCNKPAHYEDQNHLFMNCEFALNLWRELDIIVGNKFHTCASTRQLVRMAIKGEDHCNTPKYY